MDREEPQDTQNAHQLETLTSTQQTGDIPSENLGHTQDNQSPAALQEPSLNTDKYGVQNSDPLDRDAPATDVLPAVTTVLSGTSGYRSGENVGISLPFRGRTNADLSNVLGQAGSTKSVDWSDVRSGLDPRLADVSLSPGPSIAAATGLLLSYDSDNDEPTTSGEDSVGARPSQSRPSRQSRYSEDPIHFSDQHASSNRRHRSKTDGKVKRGNRTAIANYAPRGLRNRIKGLRPVEDIVTPMIINHTVKIKCMRWAHFVAFRDLAYGRPPAGTKIRPELESCAIDVLVGEPDITTSIKIDTTVKDHKPKPAAPGETPDMRNEDNTTNDGPRSHLRPPERIRFNSKELISFLFGLDSQEFITILRPFRILLHKEEQIRTSYHQLQLELAASSSGQFTADTTEQQPQSLKDPTAIASKPTRLELFRCLIQLMDEYILPRVKFVRELDCKRIYFEDLWYLFQPGDLVFEIVNENTAAVDIQVLRVLSVEGVEHRARRPRNAVNRQNVADKSVPIPFKVRCVTIEFDGKQLGPEVMHVEIDYFEDEKALRLLPLLPINRLEDASVQQQLAQTGIHLTKSENDGGIIQRLVARGKSFFDMTEMKHMHFSGTTSFGEEMDCPVMIDFEQAFASSEAQGRWADGERSKWRPDIQNLVEWTPPAATFSKCEFECCEGHQVHADHFLDRANSVLYLDSLTRGIDFKMHSLAIYPRYKHDANTQENPIKDDEFLIMPWGVYGFIFQIRKFSES